MALAVASAYRAAAYTRRLPGLPCEFHFQSGIPGERHGHNHCCQSGIKARAERCLNTVTAVTIKSVTPPTLSASAATSGTSSHQPGGAGRLQTAVPEPR